ncbi:MAG: AI-2E family transporter [Deltaproteobacteria bacterium]|jgi:predicted PurR-regulated permease PerM|nr:AI-2E family transporter [Deltaproteobacteria bacterium]
MPSTARHRLPDLSSGFAIKLFLGLGVIFMVSYLFIVLKIVFLPLVLAFLATSLLAPLVKIFRRWGLPATPAVALSLLLGFAVIWLALNFILENLIALKDGLPAYKDRFDSLLSQALEIKNRRFDFLTLELLKDQLEKIPIGRVLSGFLNSLMSFSGYFFLTLILTLYFLPALPAFPAKLRKAFPGEKGLTLCQAVDAITAKVQSYILVKALVSLGTGLVFILVCGLFGVDFASSFGIFAFFLNFIPTVGIVASLLLPAIMAFVQYGWTTAVWLSLALAVPSAVILNFVEPLLLGRSVNISPVTALLALLFWGFLWGGVGMIVAVPATAVIKLTCDSFKDLKPIGALMGN